MGDGDEINFKANPNIYRAKLNCQCGRDVLEHKAPTPIDVSRLEWAMYFLFNAVEEIANELAEKRQQQDKPNPNVSPPKFDIVNEGFWGH